MGVSRSDTGLRSIILPRPAHREVADILFASRESKETRKDDVVDSQLRELAVRLEKYLEGYTVFFPDKVDLEGATPFQQEVWLELRNIPYGSTISYGCLASRLGKPNSARAVGQALASNPLPIVLPCHRVIGSKGNLTGYAGGLDFKKSLLRLETLQF